MAAETHNLNDVANATSIPPGLERAVNPSIGYGTGERMIRTTEGLDVVCGPLINYIRMSNENTRTFWHGTVLIVTKPGQRLPRLLLKAAGPVTAATEEVAADVKIANGTGSLSQTAGEVIEGLQLYSDATKTFWRFSIRVPLEAEEARWEYTIPDIIFATGASKGSSRTFVVPSVHESMRIMFHSCNGFSVGTDEAAWSGPALWNSVLRLHQQKPFHVMIGGGDQIYNDNVRVTGPLKVWTAIDNPVKRQRYPFDEDMRKACDEFYFENYIRWFSTEPFAIANAQIPQVNIWDDHDIIDGFGSYTDHFMKCSVFRGIGGVAFKYYCLFQHHVAPPPSTFTTASESTMSAQEGGTAGIDPQQLEGTYVYKETADNPSWIVGTKPGPYVEEKSRSLYMRLGKRIAFLGIDGRTERTRKTVNYPETYDLLFDRLENEVRSAGGEIKHLILLLGIPIAYPRLQWLENLFTSPIIGPIRLLNKRFGVGGHLFNSFDGQVDLLDDLDDHYTSKHHKEERRVLMHRLQKFSRDYSVRVTILGGDVHLGALGRFYSKPKLNIPAENDHRYMANVISSAITNKPPPKAVANLLARRNKIHHLDLDTDETLLKIFDRQPGGKDKAAEWNHVTMPSRNFSCITEVLGASDTNGTAVGSSPSASNTHEPAAHDNTPTTNGHISNSHAHHAKSGHDFLHAGEMHAGTMHPAADGISNTATNSHQMTSIEGGLNVSIMVEIDPCDPEGRTEGYGFCVPPLDVKAAQRESTW